MKTINTTNQNYFFSIGRRKTSVAKVRLYKGTGKNTVNGKEFNEFYPLEVDRKIVIAPLSTLNMQSNFYFDAKVLGGGSKGSREAISLGIARALVKYDESLKKELSDNGFMTRDPRMVERKHTGFRKARKKPQYSKR